MRGDAKIKAQPAPTPSTSAVAVSPVVGPANSGFPGSAVVGLAALLLFAVLGTGGLADSWRSPRYSLGRRDKELIAACADKGFAAGKEDGAVKGFEVGYRARGAELGGNVVRLPMKSRRS